MLQKPLKKAIIKVEQELLQAMMDNDVKKLDKLLHDDLLFNIPSGDTITKEIDLASYRSGSMVLHKVTAEDRIINIIDDTAIVSTTIIMEGTYNEFVLDGKYRIIRVWKFFGDQWKVIAGSSSSQK